MTIALRPIALAALLVSGLHGRAGAEPDEATKAVVAYDLTLATAQGVASFYEAMGKWATTHRKELDALNAAMRGAPLPEAMKRFEAVPEVKGMLDAAGISANDAFMLPQALASTLAAVYAEANGAVMPPGAVNRANFSLVMREHAKLDALAFRIREARRALGQTK